METFTYNTWLEILALLSFGLEEGNIAVNFCFHTCDHSHQVSPLELSWNGFEGIFLRPCLSLTLCLSTVIGGFRHLPPPLPQP